MAGRGDVPTLWEMLTDANASAFGATDYGLAGATRARWWSSIAPTRSTRFSTEAPRTLVLRDGELVAWMDPSETRIERAGGQRSIEFLSMSNSY